MGAVGAMLCVASCSEVPTRIVLLIEAEPQLAARLDAVDVTMRREGAATETDAGHYALVGPGSVSLSAPDRDGQLVLQPRDPADARRVFVTVTGLLQGGGGSVQQVALTRFVRERTLYLHMVLTASCVAVPCTGSTSCQKGRCAPLTEQLLPQQPPVVMLVDASLASDRATGEDATGWDSASAIDIPMDTPDAMQTQIDAIAGLDSPVEHMDHGDASEPPDWDAQEGDASEVIEDVSTDWATDALGDRTLTDGHAPSDEGDAGGAVSTQRSCAIGATPGCGLVEIVGGSFAMGVMTNCSTPPTATCAYEAAPTQINVIVGNFALDAYEVTVARFRAFWASRMGDAGVSIRAMPIRYPGGTSIAWDGMAAEPVRQSVRSDYNWTPTPAMPSREAHPMNGVDWWTAQEFCVWDGGRLPTESEWEYAARGRVVDGLTEGRLYPWGDTAPTILCDRAQWRRCEGEDGSATRRVGRFPDGASAGVYDLSGNVWEWAADNYTAYSTTVSTISACASRAGWRNPLCLSEGRVERVLRGGSVSDNDVSFVRAPSRISFRADVRQTYVGFRCGRTRP